MERCTDIVCGATEEELTLNLRRGQFETRGGQESGKEVWLAESRATARWRKQSSSRCLQSSGNTCCWGAAMSCSAVTVCLCVSETYNVSSHVGVWQLSAESPTTEMRLNPAARPPQESDLFPLQVWLRPSVGSNVFADCWLATGVAVSEGPKSFCRFPWPGLTGWPLTPVSIHPAWYHLCVTAVVSALDVSLLYLFFAFYIFNKSHWWKTRETDIIREGGDVRLVGYKCCLLVVEVNVCDL